MSNADEGGVRAATMPWLVVPLDESRDAAGVLTSNNYRRCGLHDESTRVWLELMAPDLVSQLRILAVIGVIGHVTVLVAIVIVGLRLIDRAQF